MCPHSDKPEMSKICRAYLDNFSIHSWQKENIKLKKAQAEIWRHGEVKWYEEVDVYRQIIFSRRRLGCAYVWQLEMWDQTKNKPVTLSYQQTAMTVVTWNTAIYHLT